MEVEAKSVADKELLEILLKRQDQLLAFFNSLEAIRWKFTSAFGIGAVLALFFGTDAATSETVNLLALILVVVLCVAGIIAQIRIYALVVTIWRRILNIQTVESRLLIQRYQIDCDLQEAMFYPRVGIYKKRVLYYLTVGMVSCVVFAVILSIAVSSFLIMAHVAAWVSLLAGAVSATTLSYLSYRGADYYMSAISLPMDETY